MKAAIYNPYLDTLGGGERYMLGVIQAFERAGYSVDVEWGEREILGKLALRFGTSLNKTKVVDSINRGDGYDACFWVSDGSIPTLRSRNNILHFQVPFVNVNGRTLLNKMKLFRIKSVVVNSSFTKNFVDKEYGLDGKVIYPPVSVNKFKAKRKEKMVLYVGRFSKLTQLKRQDVLLAAFKSFWDKHKDWQMVIAGGTEVGDSGLADKLEADAKGFPIEIVRSPTLATLKEFYGKAKMFWSAAGYGVDELKQPHKVEHFGITVVEAMAAGCVPLAVRKGGYKEIVEDGKNGFLWRTKRGLVKKASKVASDNSLFRELSKEAKSSSIKYSEERFVEEFSTLL